MKPDINEKESVISYNKNYKFSHQLWNHFAYACLCDLHRSYFDIIFQNVNFKMFHICFKNAKVQQNYKKHISTID